jgi:hypothetical protein
MHLFHATGCGVDINEYFSNTKEGDVLCKQCLHDISYDTNIYLAKKQAAGGVSGSGSSVGGDLMQQEPVPRSQTQTPSDIEEIIQRINVV